MTSHITEEKKKKEWISNEFILKGKSMTNAIVIHTFSLFGTTQKHVYYYCQSFYMKRLSVSNRNSFVQ